MLLSAARSAGPAACGTAWRAEDQLARARKHQLSKPIFDWGRQAERLKFLVRNRLTDSAGNYGASLGLPRGQEFAVLHDPDAVLAERW